MITDLILAPAVDPSPSDLAQYGPIGIVAALFLIALIAVYKALESARTRERDHLLEQNRLDEERHARELRAGEERLDEERRRGDRLEAALSRLIETTQSSTMQTVADAHRAVADVMDLLRRGQS